jgi:hypothetical protein
MPIQSSFPAVADQVISFNKNIVDILSKINSLATTQNPSVNIQIYDENGVLRNYTVPSFTSLKGEIDRLNNNINSLYSIDAAGAMIQTTNQNTYKKIITVDLNKEPTAVGSIGSITKFKALNNWFFDSLLSPIVSIELNLTGKIEDNVRKVQSRRYIVDFAKDASGAYTALGQSALNSFNTLFRGNSSIDITDFENWHNTTSGVVEPLNPKFDEQVFDLDPNELLYDGVFSVLRIQEDRLNRKLWYVLDTLNYVVRSNNQIQQLTIGSEIIVNSDKTSTRYKVIEVSTSESNPRVRLERVEGMEPIPVGISTIKIYSPVIYTKSVKISVGYNERDVIFIKPLNADNNLLARNFSLGTGFWTNDLTLDSTAPENGLTMEQFYIDYVYDYGEVLQDLVAKKTPNKLAGTPIAPTLNLTNFKVVQINKHLTDTPDSNLIKQKHNYQMTLKSEIEQIQDALVSKNKKVKFTKFQSESAKQQVSLESEELIRKKDSRSKLLSTITQEIIDLSKNPNNKVDPKFRVRGFWTMPDAIVTRGTRPQEIVQFRIQYRYVSKDGSEPPVQTFAVDATQTKAAFSNWVEFKTDARKRTYDPATSAYTWQIEDIEKADTPNINQIDIAIQPNEKVEMRIKSISEVGWPESPTESDWSEILTVDFPTDLNNVLNDNDFILKAATSEDLKIKMNQELSAKGLDDHLSDTVVVNNLTFHHDSNKILSGFKDENGTAQDLFTYLKSLQERIASLEEKIKRAKGELEVVILRGNNEYFAGNGSETTFNIECEDYLKSISISGESGRIYSNNIYVIKDFIVKFRNKSTSSALGLLSGRTYLQNPDVYNTGAPQTFWVNAQDELITSDISGQTRTQLNNQYIWTVNYDSVLDTSVTKLTENIGNLFTTDSSSDTPPTNSLTNVLSSTEYNLGYNETSILSFIGSNKSLLDSSKWIDQDDSASSTSKLLTSIHPVVPNLETIVETNSDKVKSINAGDNNSTIIPINIYFKMNSLDSNQSGLNFNYINLNGSSDTVKHIKKIKFFLENEAENRPFTFSIKFNINRSKVIMTSNSSYISSSSQDVSYSSE